MNNNLPTWSLFALVLVLGVLALAACAEGVCPTCEYTFCRSTDRSKRLLARVVQWLTGAHTTTLATPRALAAVAFPGPGWPSAAFTPIDPVLTVTALRI